ncbi:hypothetical protein Pcinc_022546 [Petrolisthes cinctipes]|uniref:Uncharacterized protein n=1 Tax=Petrolisthes cinctipes TaxID=88211 RepID=A0AAE1FHH7_PETCI|nr:hypothetical protein Pcinc_022546 [Petrolisthes cinctipes]
MITTFHNEDTILMQRWSRMTDRTRDACCKTLDIENPASPPYDEDDPEIMDVNADNIPAAVSGLSQQNGAEPTTAAASTCPAVPTSTSTPGTSAITTNLQRPPAFRVTGAKLPPAMQVELHPHPSQQQTQPDCLHPSPQCPSATPNSTTPDIACRPPGTPQAATHHCTNYQTHATDPCHHAPGQCPHAPSEPTDDAQHHTPPPTEPDIRPLPCPATPPTQPGEHTPTPDPNEPAPVPDGFVTRMVSEPSSEQSALLSPAHSREGRHTCSGQSRVSSPHCLLRESPPVSVSPAFSGFMDESVSVPELWNCLQQRVDSTLMKSSIQQPGTMSSPRAAREQVTVTESFLSLVQVDSPPTFSQATHRLPTDTPGDTVHFSLPRNYFLSLTSTGSDEEDWTRVPSHSTQEGGSCEPFSVL